MFESHLSHIVATPIRHFAVVPTVLRNVIVNDARLTMRSQVALQKGEPTKLPIPLDVQAKPIDSDVTVAGGAVVETRSFFRVRCGP